jgi:hypothetical protein
MTKTVLYTYFGTNWTITSEVHLEDIYYLRKTRLTADAGKFLTNGTRKVVSVIVADEDVDKWTEVDK